MRATDITPAMTIPNAKSAGDKTDHIAMHKGSALDWFVSEEG